MGFHYIIIIPQTKLSPAKSNSFAYFPTPSYHSSWSFILDTLRPSRPEESTQSSQSSCCFPIKPNQQELLFHWMTPLGYTVQLYLTTLTFLVAVIVVTIVLTHQITTQSNKENKRQHFENTLT